MKQATFSIVLCVLTFFAFSYWSRPTASVDPQDSYATAKIARGDVSVWVSLKGDLDAHSVATIASRNNREAVLIEIIPEGTRVDRGDILAKLDSRELHRQLHRLNKEVDLANNTFESLVSAKHPLQLSELRSQLGEVGQELESKRNYLKESEALAKEKIIAPAEVRKTRQEVSRLQAKQTAIHDRLKIIKDNLHPAELRSAKAALQAARLELEEVNRDIAQSVIVAPDAGLVSYLPLPVGGDFRTARVGDSIYPNQPFMVIPDMRQLVVKALVPEIDVGRIQKQAQTIVKPVAYPELTLEGRVQHVGRVAQQKPGKPNWQRYFPVTVKLDQTPADLRPGLTVVIHIQTYFSEDVTVIPRAAVVWKDDKAFVRIPGIGGVGQLIPVSLGPGNDDHFEVRSGLQVGDTFLM